MAEKEKDLSEIVKYLTRTFAIVTNGLPKANADWKPKGAGPNQLYSLQTEFAYLLNEITQGPRCMLQKAIADCNEFLDNTIQELR